MAADAVLAPTPVAVLPMAADAAETVLAPMPIATPPVAADDDAEPVVAPALPPVAAPPMSVDDAEDVLVPMPAADQPLTEDDAVVPTLVALAPPPEQTSPSATDANEEEVPSQAEIDKVTDVKENETSHCILPLLPSKDDESNHGAFHKQPEETAHPSDHSVSGNQQPMDAFDDEYVLKSGPEQPLSCPSNQQLNLTLTPLGMRNMMRRRGLVDPRRVMRNQYGEDMYYMDSRFRSNRDGNTTMPTQAQANTLEDIDDLYSHSHVRVFNDQRDHSDESDRIHDGDACRLGHQFHHRDAHYPIFCGRCRRIGCPCHCNDQRYLRNIGHQWSPGFIPYNPMDIARERWSPPKPDCEHMGRWFSPKPDIEKEKYNVGAALFNPHRWTCFLNCILQCMVHTVPLVLKLQDADHPDPCPRDSIGFCCYCSLKQHAIESIKRSGSAIYPMSFVDGLSSISLDFEKGVQQDAQELLRCLLDKLDESSIAPSSSEEPPSTEGGIAKEVFGGRLKSQLHCPECNHCSDRSEAFLDLSLEVNMVETLTDSLDSFTKVEVIEDVMCDGCKSRVSMEKHLKVEQAPEVLVIHLKRFLNSGHNIYKIWDKVKYTFELDIDPFMCSVDDVPQKYDLYGVVEHLGTYAKGHYVCYIRSSKADWYKFDDDSVSRLSEEEVLDGSSYLLFYVKQDSSPWFSSLLEKENKIPPDGSAEGGPDELLKDKEVSTSPNGQDGADSLGKPAENENGPSLVRVTNGSTLSDEPEQMEEGCSLGGISGGTQELSSITGSGGNNEHADRLAEPLEPEEDDSPRGSLQETKEMKGSTQGDKTGTQESSPGMNGGTLSLLRRTSAEPSTNSSLHDDQKVGSSGVLSDFWTCSSEKNATLESSSSDEEDEMKIGNNGIRKGKCKQL